MPPAPLTRRSPSIARFETDRLSAECFRPDHFDQLCLLHQDAAVMATLGGVRSAATTRAFLHEKLAHWEAYGFGYWMFYRKPTGSFAGRGGIQHIEIGGRAEIEIGYTVVAELWGQGYATEMAEALATMGFNQLRVDNLVSFTLTDNRASQRVMEKIGFVFERTVIHAGRPHVLYRLTPAQFTPRRTT